MTLGWLDGQPITWQGAGWLLWWLAWPVMFGLLLLARRRRLADWARLVPVHSRGSLWCGSVLGSRRPVILVGASAAAALVALMRPAWGYTLEQRESQQLSVIVAIDVSDSMLAADVVPSRLEQARRDVLDLFERAQGERFGIVSFAGSAFVESPVTEDLAALRERLMAMEPALLPVPGSRLDLAIYRSLQLLGRTRGPLAPDSASTNQEGSQTQDAAALVIFSDGEADASGSLAAVAEARKLGVRVFTVGQGTEQGAPVPDLRSTGQFRRNLSGGLVTSRMDASLLGRIAAQGGGLYMPSQVGDRDMVRLYERGLHSLASGLGASGEQETRRVPREMFQAPLFFAVIALMSEWFLGRPRVSGLRGRWSALRGLLVLFCVASLGRAQGADAADALGTLHRRAKQHFDNGQFAEAARAWKQRIAEASAEPGGAPAEDYYNLGAALYRSGDFAGAAQALRLAAGKVLPGKAPGNESTHGPQQLSPSDTGRLADILHNLGNAELRGGQAAQAVQAYERSLELRPQDSDTAANLRLAREFLAQQSQQQPASSDGKKPSGTNAGPQPQMASQDASGSPAAAEGNRSDPGGASSELPSESNDTLSQRQRSGEEGAQDSRESLGQGERHSDHETSASALNRAQGKDVRSEQRSGTTGAEQQAGQESQEGLQAGDPNKASVPLGRSSQSSGPRTDQPGSSDQNQQGRLSPSEVDKTLNRLKDDARSYRQGRAQLEAEQQLERYGAPQGGPDW